MDRLDAADDPVAVQDRDDVVAVLALRLRHVHLEPVVEAPEELGARAVVDQPVERREERDAVRRDGAVRRVGMHLELAALEPHAERAEAQLVDQRLGLLPRQLLRLRVPALGEVPDALVAAPADDGDLAAHVQHLEHQPDLARAPPAMSPGFLLGVRLDLAAEQRAARLELAQDIAPEGRVFLEVRDEVVVSGAGAPAHLRLQQRQVFGGIEERVPLDELPLLPEQPVELGAVVGRAEPAPEHEVLRRRDGRDRVELQEAEPADRREHVRRRAVEQLRADGDPPRLLERDSVTPCVLPARARSFARGVRRRARASRRRRRGPSARA